MSYSHALTLRRQRIVRDSLNVLRYGQEAPRWNELIWVDPRSCLGNPFPKQKGYLKSDSARVINTWPKTEPGPPTQDERIKACLDHWVDGLSWEETGRIDEWHALIHAGDSAYGCRTRQDIIDRCAAWDRLFERVKSEGRLRSQQELRGPKHRELGGIGVHVGPDGRIYKGRDGHHRFAIALALGLTVIPATVGLVYRGSLDHLQSLRRQPHDMEPSHSS